MGFVIALKAQGVTIRMCNARKLSCHLGERLVLGNGVPCGSVFEVVGKIETKGQVTTSPDLLR